MSFLIASASLVSFSVGTRRPVLLFSMISGMPPVRVAMTGSPETIASKFTSPNASRTDGRMNMLALFIRCGMFFLWPRRMT